MSLRVRDGPTASTLQHALRDLVEQQPDEVTAVIHARRSVVPVTGLGLGRLAAGHAAALEAEGVRRGDRVVIARNTSTDFLAAFWGCQLLGAVAVPAPSPTGGRTLSERARCEMIIRWATPTAVSMAASDASRLPLELRAANRFVEQAPEAALGAAPSLPAAPDDPAVIQFTSGSTSEPRGCVLTHRAVVANLMEMSKRMSIDHRQRGVVWCPLFHDMGLMSIVVLPVWSKLLVGVLMPPEDFVLSPLRWLQAMSDYRAEISAAPTFAFALVTRRLQRAEALDLDLSCVRSVVCGAEPIPSPTLRRFLDAVAPYGFPRTAVQPAYGLAEHVLMVASRPAGLRTDRVRRRDLDRGWANTARAASPASTTLECVSVGRPVDGCQVRVVDSHRMALPERAIGEIELRSPSVMSGYFGAPEVTADTVLDGWLRTGDLGYLADGELYVTGRVKDTIIVAGRNLFAFEVEQAVDDLDGVRPGGVVAFGVPSDHGECLAVVAEARASVAAGLLPAIRSTCVTAVGIGPKATMIVPRGRLPRTSSGKVRRRLARSMFLEDRFEVLARD